MKRLFLLAATLMSMNAYALNWECLENSREGCMLSRASMSQGWLVAKYEYEVDIKGSHMKAMALTYVPDNRHLWDGN